MRPARDHLKRMSQLVRRLGETEAKLQALAGGEADAIIAPVFASPILLAQAQDALRRNEQRLRTLYASLPAGVIVHTTAGQIREVNSAASAVLGLPLDPSADAGTALLWHVFGAGGDEHGSVRNLWSVLLSRGQTVRNRVLGLAAGADAAPRWLLVNSEPIRTPTGEVTEVVTTFVDITDLRTAEASRRRAEMALGESEERFRTAFAGALIGMALVKPDGELLQVNPAFCRLLGYGEAKLSGTPLSAYAWPGEWTRSEGSIKRLLTGETSACEMEMRFRHQGGACIWTQTGTALVRSTSGQPLYLVFQIQDITARKEHEMELMRLANHDALTKLYNRHYFREVVDHQLTLATRYGSPGAVLFIDLDNFKAVNDAFGHAMGDEFLGSLARAVVRRLRVSDVVARSGGDEYAVLLPRASQAEARAVAADILQVVRHHELVVGDMHVRTTASVGVCFFPLPAGNIDKLLALADLAMYQAKSAGGNRFQICHANGPPAGEGGTATE